MKHFAPFVFLFLVSLVARSQALPIVEIEGQKYYSYTLQAGQTLSQLEALTQQDIDQLLVLNPGLERGIEAGATLIFPVKRGILQHKVAAQQTLFAISRLYEVPVDSLYAYNPSAKAGLKVGQTLRIPNAVLPFTVSGSNTTPTSLTLAVSHTFAHKLTDTIIKHTVLEKENLYAISKRYMVSVDTLLALNHLSSSRVSPGQQILVPIRSVNTQTVPIQTVPAALPLGIKADFEFPVPSKAHYNIAIFLPFQLDSTAQFNRFVAAAALDYYMGLKMALDSLNKLGFSADLHIFDDNAQAPSLAEELKSPVLQTMDLIFAPLQEKQAKLVAEFAQTNGIPVVFPVQLSKSITQLAPNFITYTTSDQALLENLAQHLQSKYQSQTIVLIESPIAADQILEQQFKMAFENAANANSKLKLQKATWATYQKFKAVGGPQILVSFSSERAKVVGLLKAAAADSSLLIVGTKDWLDFKELDVPEVRDQPFLVALPSYFSYHAPQIIRFHKTYRKRYNADLTKMSCLGYDLMLHMGLQLLGKPNSNTGLISNMHLRMSSNGAHIENAAAVVVLYQNAQLPASRHE